MGAAGSLAILSDFYRVFLEGDNVDQCTILFWQVLWRVKFLEQYR